MCRTHQGERLEHRYRRTCGPGCAWCEANHTHHWVKEPTTDEELELFVEALSEEEHEELLREDEEWDAKGRPGGE
jgi:hypothetical protein